ncbi:MAG TPA: MOSC domain-containing protein [bacterium]|nr:MOSC domain-containing protein [bacterium]
MTDGTVLSLQILTHHGERPRAVHDVRALPGHGLEGDIHGKSRSGSGRQVLIVDRTTLDAFGLRPGDLREQITVAFAALESLPAGTLLQAGEVTLELTGPCEPCTHIGGLNGVVDPIAFQKALDGRRGQLARVIGVEGEGRIRSGDRIAVRTPAPR